MRQPEEPPVGGCSADLVVVDAPLRCVRHYQVRGHLRRGACTRLPTVATHPGTPRRLLSTLYPRARCAKENGFTGGSSSTLADARQRLRRKRDDVMVVPPVAEQVQLRGVAEEIAVTQCPAGRRFLRAMADRAQRNVSTGQVGRLWVSAIALAGLGANVPDSCPSSTTLES